MNNMLIFSCDLLKYFDGFVIILKSLILTLNLSLKINPKYLNIYRNLFYFFWKNITNVIKNSLFCW